MKPGFNIRTGSCIIKVRRKMSTPTRTEALRLRACELAEEIRIGRWSHIKDLERRPASACEEIVSELQRRCPGFDRATYQEALASGMFETR